MFDTALHDAKLNLKFMKDWKNRVVDADEKVTTAVSQVAEVKVS